MKWVLVLLGCSMGTLLPGQDQNTNENPRQQALEEASHSPIDFWGKVVDENGKPIEGATVIFTLDKVLFDENKPKKVVVSDANGRFLLKGETGIWLSVRVEKNGYDSSFDEANASLDYSRKAKENLTSFRRGDANEPFPTEQKPTLFVLTKKV